MLNQTLPYPKRFRIAAKFGNLGKAIKPLLPSSFRAMLDLLPQELPESDPLQPVYSPHGEPKARVACSRVVLSRRSHLQSIVRRSECFYDVGLKCSCHLRKNAAVHLPGILAWETKLVPRLLPISRPFR